MSELSLKVETYSYKTEVSSEGTSISVVTSCKKHILLDSEQGNIF